MEVLNNSLEAVKEWLNDLTDDEILNIHNEYCDKANYTDDEVYHNNEEFFETFFSNAKEAKNTFFLTIYEAVRAVSNNGKYKYYDDYVTFDGYANLESSSDIKELIDIDELAEYIFENPEEFEIELEEEEI